VKELDGKAVTGFPCWFHCVAWLRLRWRVGCRGRLVEWPRRPSWRVWVGPRLTWCGCHTRRRVRPVEPVHVSPSRASVLAVGWSRGRSPSGVVVARCRRRRARWPFWRHDRSGLARRGRRHHRRWCVAIRRVVAVLGGRRLRRRLCRPGVRVRLPSVGLSRGLKQSSHRHRLACGPSVLRRVRRGGTTWSRAGVRPPGEGLGRAWRRARGPMELRQGGRSSTRSWLRRERRRSEVNPGVVWA
jgi:hypothetical protein